MDQECFPKLWQWPSNPRSTSSSPCTTRKLGTLRTFAKIPRTTRLCATSGLGRWPRCRSTLAPRSTSTPSWRSPAGTYPRDSFPQRLLPPSDIQVRRGLHEALPRRFVILGHALHQRPPPQTPLVQVRILQTTDEIQLACKQNLAFAVHCALTQLPERFDDVSLFNAITSLSYMGDMRMSLFGLGENPNKISNIVRGSLERFRCLYKDTIQECSFVTGLPSGYERVDNAQLSRMPFPPPVNKILRSSPDKPLRDVVREAVSKTVRRTTWQQTLKGTITAGGFKSFRYAASKLVKAIRA
eukprot:c20274_g1_i1.p1 GENE.c20274_g1_i1~~c20274_g1_i1.p1  ORF type:complete len:298 (+),score=32.21 c20274_g1_i1:113-1006(+)